MLRISLFLLLAVRAFSATYYIDWTGGSDTNNGTSKVTAFKRSKGMGGCTSNCNAVTVTPGDIFIYKGGETWPSSISSWAIPGSSSSTDITYTTDVTWFSGGSYTQPKFDGGGAGQLVNNTIHDVTINDLHFQNCGVTVTSNSIKCVEFDDSYNLTITNNTFNCECWIEIYIPILIPGSYSNYILTGNDFSHLTGALWMGINTASATLHNLTYNSNTFHDYHSQIGGGTHGDGAFHYFSVPASDTTQFIDNITFCNNRFYGDFTSFDGSGGMTAFFFTEGSASGLLCNNIFSYDHPQSGIFQSEVFFWGHTNNHASNLKVYNNSFVAIGTNAMSSAFDVFDLGTSWVIDYKNNACYNPQYCMGIEDASSVAAVTSDYNLQDSSSGQLQRTSFISYATWQGFGLDTHGVMGSSPSWVSAPGDVHLNSGSPARNAGTDLTTQCGTYPLLCSDYDGVARPNGSAWDIGAYQYSTIVSTGARKQLGPRVTAGPRIGK